MRLGQKRKNIVQITHVVIFMCLGVTFSLFMCSCAVMDWFAGNVSNEEVKDMDKDISGMTAKQTRYDQSLKDFGRMLDAYNIAPIRIQSKIISNQTADKSLPDDISRMLISSVNKIGKRVTYVPYDPNYVISEASTGGKINRALPQIVIAGGITEYDKDMIEKQRELKAEAQIQEGDFGSKYSHDGGLGYKAGSAISRVTLDMQLLNYKTQAYLAGIQAINSVNLRRSKLGWSVGYYFQGMGGGFDYSLSKKQGKYHAIRLLVELSVLEILGKYFDVPYWRCIKNFPRDTAMIRRITEEFADLSYSDQNSYLEEYLFFHGYIGIDRNGNTQTDAEIRAINNAMKKFKCNNRAELFAKLWENVPINEARERNRKYARELSKMQQIRQDEYSAKVQKYNNLVSNADNLVNNNKLAQARVYYEQAHNLFPDQQGPVQMIQKIDEILANKNNISQTAVSTAEKTKTVKQTTKSSTNNSKQQKKEAPLNPFQKVEW